MKDLAAFWLIALCVSAGPVRAQEEHTDTTAAQPQVARAQFTTAIEDREPVDQVVVASPPLDELFFFTDLRHMEGQTVSHTWRYHGEPVSNTSFKVGGPRWRVYSKARIEPGQFGEWSVTVADDSGWPLYTELFRYEPAAHSEAGAARGRLE